MKKCKSPSHPRPQSLFPKRTMVHNFLNMVPEIFYAYNDAYKGSFLDILLEIKHYSCLDHFEIVG